MRTCPKWRVPVRALRRVPVAAAAVIALLVGFAPAAAAAAAVHYVALGDSYSSGVGAGDYTSESGACERSPHSYTALWATAHSPSSFVSVACADATTSDVASSQLSALGQATTLVSITVGGNDENFKQIMIDCNLFGTAACVSDVDAAEADARANLPGKLGTLYDAIRSDAPNARVVVLAYPDFYDLAHDCVGLSEKSRAKIDEGVDLLDRITRVAAGHAGFAFADARAAFAGHEICDQHRWLHSLDLIHVHESYHPTAAGYSQAYYPTFSAAAG